MTPDSIPQPPAADEPDHPDQPVSAEAADQADEAIAAAQRDAALRDQHSLIRERRPVYVLDVVEARRRTGSAERMARKRQRDAERAAAAGVVRIAGEVPAQLAAEIQRAGGLSAWLAARSTSVAVAVPAPTPIVGTEQPATPPEEVSGEAARIVERRVEVPVPAPLDAADQRRLRVGRAVEAVTGWKRMVVRVLVGV